jgi:ATP-dependent Clp protease ATP-binding subunit ClpA
VNLAKDAVRIRKDRLLGPRHLLAAIAAEGNGIAAKLLRAKGFELADIVAQLAPELGHDHVMIAGPPVKWTSLRIIQSAVAESEFLGDDIVRTEHLLLALLANQDKTTASVLASKINHAETIGQLLDWKASGMPQSKDDLARRLNEQAWALAITRDSVRRDPAKALELATRACELTGFAAASCLDTLGVCYAACNQFDQAIRYVELAMQRCEGAEYAGCQRRLEMFRAGEAYFD